MIRQKKKKICSLVLTTAMLVSTVSNGAVVYAKEGHVHTEECYAEAGDLLCSEAESEGHVHGAECYEMIDSAVASDTDAQKKLVCEIPETEGHTHAGECFAKGGELVCGLEENTDAGIAVQAAQNEFSVSNGAEFVDALNAINAAADGEYVITLTDDIEISGDYDFTKNTTTILGEGHTISGGFNQTLGVNGDAVLNLGSEDYTKELIIDGEKGPTGPLVSVANGGTFNLYDHVTLQNNDMFGAAAGVQIEGENSLFNMYGGVIDNCSNGPSFYAGGVMVSDGTFRMFDGVISNCSGGYGGGICGYSGKIYISGGKIIDNNATYGGGLSVLYMKTGWFTQNVLSITGGEISGNKAEYGGGIMLDNSNTPEAVSGAVITKNESKVGGGIAIRNNSEINISGLNNVICNNKATARAADIYVESGSKATLFDVALMDQTYADTDEKIDGWYVDDNPRYVPSEDAVPVDISKRLNGEQALVASYKVVPKADVTYDLDGGIGTEGISYEAEKVAINDKITVKAAPTKDGYTFVEWSDGENTYQPGDVVTITEATVFKAVWKLDTGSLNISQSVSGTGADEEKEFHFTVTLNDTAINGTYGDITFAGGIAEFVLKHNENKTVAGLPAGVAYTVSETEANQDNYVTDAENAVGTVAKDETIHIVFSNVKNETPAPPEPEKKTGDLTIIALADEGNDTEFTVTVTLNDTTINGMYGDVTFVNGVASVTLKGGERKTAAGLLEGISYTATETPIEGYEISGTGTTGKIAKDQTSEVIFTSKKITVPDNNNSNHGSSSGSDSDSDSGSTTGKQSSDSQNTALSGHWNQLSDRENHWTFTPDNGTVLKDCWAYLKNPYAMQTQSANAWFRFDANGDMVFGWYKDSKTGDWYVLHNKADGMLGMMITGWYKDEQDGRWYYLDPASGKMLTGWQNINGSWYYLNTYTPEITWTYDGTSWKFNGSSERPYGSMYADETTPDGYRVDENGSWVR